MGRMEVLKRKEGRTRSFNMAVGSRGVVGVNRSRNKIVAAMLWPFNAGGAR